MPVEISLQKFLFIDIYSVCVFDLDSYFIIGTDNETTTAESRLTIQKDWKLFIFCW